MAMVCTVPFPPAVMPLRPWESAGGGDGPRSGCRRPLRPPTRRSS